MRLEKASYKAVSYACLNFHYAKRIPAQPMTGINVFNNKNEWCGVVVFNIGIGNINKPFNLPNGAVCELVRVALNGKQETTSKAVSIAVKVFKKINPLCKLLVSYADTDQNHYGTIYKAMNWYFISSHKTGDKYINPKNGKEVHSRSHSPKGYNKQFGEIKKVLNTNDLIRVKTGLKNKYIYPLTKNIVPLCKLLSKPYPKKITLQERRANESGMVESNANSKLDA
tara:strand:+ start:223 stop:900 length:678 start_codon:yes stop_codon:yes gene_type:complete